LGRESEVRLAVGDLRDDYRVVFILDWLSSDSTLAHPGVLRAQAVD
jgi:hypothetical protein